MGPGHAQGILIVAHEGTPGLGPLEHGDTGGPGGGDLRVVIVWTAAVRMTQSAPATLSGRWPMVTGMPRVRRWATSALSCMSEPVTTTPAPWSTWARGDMDTPPMPTRWALRPGAM